MTLQELLEAAQGGSPERLRAQGLPQGVAEAVAASAAQASPWAKGAGARPPHPLPPLTWRAVPGGGWVLAEPARRHGLLRWAELDRAGHLTALLHWTEAPGDLVGAPRLVRAAVRAPGSRWAGLLPLQGTSGLWAPADAIVTVPAVVGAAGAPPDEHLASMPPQLYARLTHIPPVDRPGALPRGVGTALLNLLAQLMTDQHRDTVRYLGPYPTPALFDALCVSFAPRGEPVQARERFTQDAAAQAFAGKMREQPLPWTPRPYVAAVDAHIYDANSYDATSGAPPNGDAINGDAINGDANNSVYVQWRTADMACVWLGETPFVRCAARMPMPAGGRLWREQTPHGARDVAGLVALGRPFRRYLLFDLAAGRATRAADWEEGEQAALPDGAPPQPLNELLRMAAVHWAVARCNSALAPALAELAAGLPMVWAPLPRALTCVGSGGVTLHAGLGAHFRALAVDPLQAADWRRNLALMLVSDLFAALAGDLARLGQARLEAMPTPDPDELTALTGRGQACQQAAQDALAQLLPRVLAQLAQGRLLPG